MAYTRLVVDGFGQLELNNCAFRRDGRIEAQCALGDDFNNAPAENGMILMVDNVAREVNLPAEDGLAEGNLLALNYTTEHMYDERQPGLKNFKLEKGTFLPRLGYLAVGDKFTTNCIAYDTAEFSTADDIWESDDPIYGIVTEGEGAICLTKNAGNSAALGGVLLKAVAITTMPDAQKALKFQVVKA